MSFTPANMQTFSRRCQNLMLALQNIRDEAARLDAIYTNETGSGTDPDWGDTAIATAAEHVDVITLVRDLDDFLTNQSVIAADRQATITPFIQTEP